MYSTYLPLFYYSVINLRLSLMTQYLCYIFILINQSIKSLKLSRSENTGKFLFRDLAALTNGIYFNSQCGTLMNRFPFIISYNFLISKIFMVLDIQITDLWNNTFKCAQKGHPKYILHVQL